MLNRIEVRTKYGTILSMNLGSVTDGISVQNIEGLDPGKLTEGEPREILFMLGLEPDYALDGNVQSLRNRLYKIFVRKSEVNLRFYTSETSFVEIDGIVESFEAPLFVEEPRATISILCDEHSFYNPVWVEVSGLTKPYDGPETAITNEGTVNTGVVLTVSPDQDVSSFSFIHRSQDGLVRSMDFNVALLAGDIVNISSIPGAKSVTLLRDGLETSMLRAVPPQSSWIDLPPGLSYYTVFAPNADGVPYSLHFMERYEGL